MKGIADGGGGGGEGGGEGEGGEKEREREGKGVTSVKWPHESPSKGFHHCP